MHYARSAPQRHADPVLASQFWFFLVTFAILFTCTVLEDALHYRGHVEALTREYLRSDSFSTALQALFAFSSLSDSSFDSLCFSLCWIISKLRFIPTFFRISGTSRALAGLIIIFSVVNIIQLVYGVIVVYQSAVTTYNLTLREVGLRDSRLYSKC